MCYFYLGDPIRAYPKFLVLIFIVLGCLGCSSNLAENYRAVVLY